MPERPRGSTFTDARSSGHRTGRRLPPWMTSRSAHTKKMRRSRRTSHRRRPHPPHRSGSSGRFRIGLRRLVAEREGDLPALHVLLALLDLAAVGHLGRNKRDLYRAEAIDGVELRLHTTIAAAQQAILSNDAEGKPRDPAGARLRLPPGLRDGEMCLCPTQTREWTVAAGPEWMRMVGSSPDPSL
jgi:hypothetical protein